MNENNKNLIWKSFFSRLNLLIIFIWSVLISGSLLWNIHNLQHQIQFLASSEARANWNKDQAIRRWATRHGGMYVRPDERTPPNPYLTHIDNRDITTTDGTKLTLMNPAYMMRQMATEYDEMYGIKGKITGQILLNPNNKADEWEMKALKRFDKGEDEIIETSTINDQPYLRLIRPMIMTEGCVKCHGHLGFKVGDIRGGVSVSIPMQPYMDSMTESIEGMRFTHFIIWLLGIMSVGYRTHVRQQQEYKDNEARQAIQRTQKMEAIGQLTGGIAHDFNNLLGIILGNLELLDKKLDDQPKLSKRVKSANKAARRGADMIQQLLSFTRDRVAQKINTSLNELITSMDSFVRSSITPEIQLETSLSETLWQTQIVTGEFEDALLNLVINARDAMPNGGKLNIQTSNEVLDINYTQTNPEVEPGEYVMLSISDTGEGMSKAVQENVFNPFFTTKPSGKGTGLGLSLVYAFMQHSGGHIKIYSEPGKGTTMCLYFPRCSMEEAGSDIHETIESAPGGNEEILIVDDEKELLELASSQLKDAGYHCYTASDAEEAIQVLNQQKNIQLVFSDIVMPGVMNGYELAEYINTHFPKIKTLLTSGYTQQNIVRNGQKTLNNPLLFKPYKGTEMLIRIRQILDSQNEHSQTE